MAAWLKSLVIENFRSLRGKLLIPLDAQVVLIHGSNGMGKTSVLSALELGLTGKIAHLASNGDGYRKYLTNLGATGGSIELSTSTSLTIGAPPIGVVGFSDATFNPKPLLDSENARFLAERCYLPQATLGRLLEIYDDQKTNTTSPLTLFVKELLGLDPLDALVDGLHSAFNVTRIRNLVPEFRQLESLQKSLKDELSRIDQKIQGREAAASARRGTLKALLSEGVPDASIALDASAPIEQLRMRVELERDQDHSWTNLNKKRVELAELHKRWRSIPADASMRDTADRERVDALAAEALTAWRRDAGKLLEEVLAQLRETFPNLPSLDQGPEETRSIAAELATAEAARCAALLARSNEADERLKAYQTTVQRSSARIEELNLALASGVAEARSLANALAGVAPHVDGDRCPVCDRDFAEMNQGSLAAHIAAKIASLTTEAGRLQSLANERAAESERLTVAQRNALSADREQLAPDERASLIVRSAAMGNIVQRLVAMTPEAQRGSALMAEAASAKAAVALARRRESISSSILPEIDEQLKSVVGVPHSAYDTIDNAFDRVDAVIVRQIADAERVTSLRMRLLAEMDYYTKDCIDLAALSKARLEFADRLSAVEAAIQEVDGSRDEAKKVSDSAAKVRSDIVKTVLNTSLNKVWRDLFVRLAPSEQFVPTFKLPSGDCGNVEAVLETLHRSGRPSGSPGAMLSQGNLNTAALTLFLALHLSVPMKLPCLVLDDPVQSMDDVHIAQFAALLRTLSKGMDRQVVVAVHERALFDYLILELSPAFPGDSLISVEITRNFEGDAVASPRVFIYEKDRAIAA